MIVSMRISLARAFLLTAVLLVVGCGRSDSRLSEWQRVKTGRFDIVLLSPEGTVRHGRDTLVIEFRSTPDGKLVDVGNVQATATMPMTGMPMIGSMDVTRTPTPGRYNIAAQLEMAGTWRFEVRWLAPSGSDSAMFTGTVR